MNTTIHTKNYTVSDRLNLLIFKKLEKVEKYFADDAQCTIICTRVAGVERMELTITANGHAFRAQNDDRSMYNNLDNVLQKIERQIVKNRDRLRTIIRREAVDAKHLSYISSREATNIVEPEIKKNKSFDVRTMSDKDAELNLATLDHNFFLYADETTGQIKAMYRRPDGHVGVIDITNAGLKK